MERIKKVRLATATLLAVTILFSSVFPMRTASASMGSDFLAFAPNDDSVITVGANAQIIVDFGKITFTTGCPAGGTDDTGINFFADVYLVPTGSVSVGSILKNAATADGGPNVLGPGGIGGEIIGPTTIGITMPSGHLGAGVYDVVINECQDHMLDPGDTVLTAAVTVNLPATLPPINPDLVQIKTDALEEKDKTELAHDQMHLLFLAHKWHEIAECISGLIEPAGLTACLAMGLNLTFEALTGVDIEESVLGLMENTAKQYEGINQDPADPNFMVSTSLPAVQLTQTQTSNVAIKSASDFGNSVGQEGAIANAFLNAVQRYQGATNAGNGEWGLVHAREAKFYSNLLANQLSSSNNALSNLDAAITADPIDYASTGAQVNTIQNNLATSGFSPGQINTLRDLGFSDTAINNLKTTALADTFSGTFTKTQIHDAIIAQIAQNTAMGGDLNTFSTNMDAIITNLQGQGVSDTHPIAKAGGPYAGVAGNPLTLDGSASTAPDGIKSMDWDIQGDGLFDDAHGTKPVITLNQPFNGVIGLRVTDNLGNTAFSYATLSITSSNVLPSITSFSPTSPLATITVGKSMTFNGVASDTDGDSISESWLIDGNKVGSGGSFTYSPAITNIGVHTLVFDANDNNPLGGAVDNGWSVSVSATPISTTISGPFSVTAGTPVNPSTTTTGGVPPYSFAWTLTVPAGSIAALTGGTTATPSFTPDVPGSYILGLTVTDSLGTIANAAQVIVSATAPITPLAATANPISPTEGTAFTGTVAHFTDSDGNTLATAYTVTINWGDGTISAGTITAGGGGFDVTGTHTYADEGSFTTGITINDNDGATTAAGNTAAVGEGDALTGTGNPISATKGAAFTGTVAHFTDTNPNNVASDYSATIDWGDGTLTPAIINAGGGGFDISGTHTYASTGPFAVTTMMADDAPGTATATATGTATISGGTSLPSSETVQSATGAGPVTFSTDAGGFSNLAAVSQSGLSPSPPSGSYPFGFFAWSITGFGPATSVTITATFPSTVPPGTQYLKLVGGTWLSVPISISGNTVAMTITDDGPFDADTIAGTISDPGGLLVPPNVIPPPTSAVGGSIIPVDMTSLFIAGLVTNAFWMVPTLGGVAGAALTLFKLKRKQN